MSSPSFPDVPFAPGIPSVLRSVEAGAGSIVNSSANVAIGAAQGLLGSNPAAVLTGVAGINGAISNVQLLSGATSINGRTMQQMLVNGAFGVLGRMLTSDDPSVQSAANTAEQWGIYDQNNNKILSPDSFKELDYQHSWRIANYPMEQGAFQSYNKVQTPFEVPLRLMKGGSDQDRYDFLNALETIANSFDLYDVVTPDYTYQNVSISTIGYHRAAREGAKLLTIDVYLTEVRVANKADFSNVSKPSYANSQNGGGVQVVSVSFPKEPVQ